MYILKKERRPKQLQLQFQLNFLKKLETLNKYYIFKTNIKFTFE